MTGADSWPVFEQSTSQALVRCVIALWLCCADFFRYQFEEHASNVSEVYYRYSHAN